MDVRITPGKYARNASAAAGDYADNAGRAGSKWEQNAAVAGDTHAQAMQAAIAEKRYEKGVVGKSGKYAKGISEKGRGRYGQGVAQADDEQRAGFAPFASVLQGVTLAPRGPKGTNYGRVQQVGDALIAAKRSL